MSEQEMQFADPDWKPGGQRNMTRDDAMCMRPSR